MERNGQWQQQKGKFWGVLLFLLAPGVFAFTYDVPTPIPDPHLRDNTPAALMAPDLKSGPQGPRLFLPYLPPAGPGETVEERMKPQALKISVVKGKGKVDLVHNSSEGRFAVPTPTPDAGLTRGLKEGEYVDALDYTRAGPFLFTPEGPAGTEYEIKVTCIGHPEKGELDYRFTTYPLDPAAFDQAKAAYMTQAKALDRLHYRYRMTSQFHNWDLHTQTLGKGLESAVTFIFSADSTTTIQEKKGKVEKTARPRNPVDPEKNFASLGTPWGEDEGHLIFFQPSEGYSTNADKSYKQTYRNFFFFFMDKATHNVTRTVLGGAEGNYTLNEDRYQKAGEVYVRAGGESEFHTPDKGIFSRSTSTMDEFKVLP